MFKNILPKLKLWSEDQFKELTIVGLNEEQWCFAFRSLCGSLDYFQNKNHIFLVNDLDAADKAFSILSTLDNDFKITILPGIESSPYVNTYGPEINMFNRFAILNKLALKEDKNIIIATYESFSLKMT